MNRDAIVAHAAQLAQNESVSEITVVRLARELEVAPGLIRYFVGSREELLSAVFNRALKERADSFPPLTGDWRADAEAHIRHQHGLQLKWKGMTTYAIAHNRNRLFQSVSPGETDYGLVFIERMSAILQSGGFSRSQAAMAFHLMMLFTLSVASAHVNRQHPVEHQRYLEGLVEQLDPRADPGACFLLPEFARIDTQATFDSGVKLLLDGFAGWLDEATRAPKAPPLRDASAMASVPKPKHRAKPKSVRAIR